MGPSELIAPDASAWRAWLDRNHTDQGGVWLVLAKKGTVEPTSLTYEAALEHALCYGWIDGKVERRDAATYRQRFTPRRSRSRWSQRNVENAERLIAEGRMHEAGLREVDRARADGRWEAAYSSQANTEVPDDLAEALAGAPRASAMFEILTRQNRYSILYRLENVKQGLSRRRLIAQIVTMLARGETFHPQARRLPT